LGSTLPRDIRTVYVSTFVNETGEPAVEAEATAAAVREFQKDGTLRVVTDERSADLVLKVTLTRYALDPLRYESDQEKRANEYRLRLDAAIECKRTDTGTLLTRGKVQGDTTFTLSGSIASSKLEALPDAADDLAHSIVSSVVEAW
jgi:hypothetical protein